MGATTRKRRIGRGNSRANSTIVVYKVFQGGPA